MKLYFLNVGYGEAIILTHGDFCAVIDGGTADAKVYESADTATLYEFLRGLHISTVDLMICTHIHDDHIGGLVEVAQKLPVKECWCNLVTDVRTQPAADKVWPLVEEDDLSMHLFLNAMQAYDALRDALAAQGVHMQEVGREMQPRQLCEGVTLRLFGLTDQQRLDKRTELEHILDMEDAAEMLLAMRRHDAGSNATSLAMELKSAEGSAFLTGDLVAGWDEQCAAGHVAKADLLKLTHHGQKDGMPQSLVDTVAPSVFVICSDRGRKFNSACAQVLRRCAEYFDDKGMEHKVLITGDVGLAQENCCAYCIEGTEVHPVSVRKG